MSCVTSCTYKGKAKNMSIGVRKEIDKLGRLVIPKEMRDLFKLGDSVELVITSSGILVRNPEYRLIKYVRGQNKQISDKCDFE